VPGTMFTPHFKRRERELRPGDLFATGGSCRDNTHLGSAWRNPIA
jgi:hypothetical protein